MLDIKSSMSTGIIIHLPVNEDYLKYTTFSLFKISTTTSEPMYNAVVNDTTRSMLVH